MKTLFVIAVEPCLRCNGEKITYDPRPGAPVMHPCPTCNATGESVTRYPFDGPHGATADLAARIQVLERQLAGGRS